MHLRRFKALLLSLAVLALLAPAALCLNKLPQVPYYTNLPLDVQNTDVERVIIMVHGSGRGGKACLDITAKAAKLAGQEKQTLIIAPNFCTEDDLDVQKREPGTLFWTSGGWKCGDDNRSSEKHLCQEKISSFDVVDKLVERVADRTLFPKVKTIVVAGHSAGGQFTNRYAAGSRAEQTICKPKGIAMRYAVANPSSYVYLTPERLKPGTTNVFETPPGGAAKLVAYNKYRYGLENLNRYMSKTGIKDIVKQYGERKIYYLLGDKDNDPNHSQLDRSPAAGYEGSNRFERGSIYYAYLQKVYGKEITKRQKKLIVPGVAHSSTGIFCSREGIEALFGIMPSPWQKR